MKCDAQHKNTQTNGRMLLCSVSFMLVATNKALYIECRYGECRYAECRSADLTNSLVKKTCKNVVN